MSEHDAGSSGDSVHASAPAGREEDSAQEQLEARYVHSVYNIIATHFSATRFAIWPKARTSHVPSTDWHMGSIYS